MWRGEDFKLPLREKFRRYIEYIRISEANKIARRYFIMNSFDGSVTILGVLLGVIFGGITDPSQIVGIGIATGVALMVSGFSGTIIAEEAERNKDIKELEESMLMDLKDTVYTRAARFSIVYVGIVNAIAPFLSIIISLTPLFLALANLVPVDIALSATIVVAISYMGILGILISNITGRSKLREAVKLMAIGIITTIIVSIILKPI